MSLTFEFHSNILGISTKKEKIVSMNKFILKLLILISLPIWGWAQNFPIKTTRVVVPFSAGSGPDMVMRIVGDKLAKEWGQQVMLDNKPGANGWLAETDIKRASPDGYTFATLDTTHIALQPLLYKQMPFDPIADFDPLSTLYTTKFFVVVGMNSPYKTLNDLINAAKEKNSRLTYGSWGIGSVGHLGAAMLEGATHTQMTHVPFKEMPMLYTAVSTGEVDWAFGTAATVSSLYQSKKVKFLAYAGSQRMQGYQDVPTVSEASNISGFELRTWVAVFGPKGTPRLVTEKINQSIMKALSDAEVREKLLVFGLEPWIGSASDVIKATEQDIKRYSGIIKSSNISLD